MPEARFGSKRIRYERQASRSSKYVTVKVSPSKLVTVLAPQDIGAPELDALVSRKGKWILEKFRRIDEVGNSAAAREYVSGEGFLHKGRLLRLKVRRGRATKVHSDTSSLHCRVTELAPSAVRAALLEWYRNEAGEFLPRRVTRLAKRIGIDPKSVGLRDQTLRWGSCTKDGRILLNWRVIMAPPSVVDYVVAHELVHLRRKPHSAEFWKEVKAVIPDYEVRKEWLRVNGPQLTLEPAPGRSGKV